MHLPRICWTSIPRPWIFSTIDPIMWMQKESKIRSRVMSTGRVLFQGTRHFYNHSNIILSSIYTFFPWHKIPFLGMLRVPFFAIWPFSNPLNIRSGGNNSQLIVQVTASVAIFVSNVDPMMCIVCNPLFVHVQFMWGWESGPCLSHGLDSCVQLVAS